MSVHIWKRQVFGGCMKRVSGKIYLFNHFLGVQINPIVAMESRCILPLPKGGGPFLPCWLLVGMLPFSASLLALPMLQNS